MPQQMTPMMRQYLEIKEKYKDCILFFRLGDFYEMFFDDAQTASKELELVLTGKDCGLEERAPMCGIPFHSADTYITKLIQKGYKVAICEQMEDPALAKGLVDRDVIRIITPGTVIEDKMLQGNKSNYILSVYYTGNGAGLSYSDVSTGAFYLEEIRSASFQIALIDEIIRIQPSEIIVNDALCLDISLTKKISSHFHYEKYAEKAFNLNAAKEIIKDHFHIHTLNSYGCENLTLGVSAAGALLQYLNDTQKNSLQHIKRIQVLHDSEFMVIDASTRRNLELTVPLRMDGNQKNTLLHLLNHTKTSMGGRMLYEWINRPLQNIEQINQRLDSVTEIYKDPVMRKQIQDILSRTYDIERLCSKVVYGSINARDCISLKNTLGQIPYLKDLLGSFQSGRNAFISENLDCMEEYYSLISRAIIEDAPPTIREGGFIKNGYNEKIDELHEIKKNSKKWLENFEETERNNTGIKKLRIGYNRVFGYYIEITKSNYDQIPENYIRKQTLANAERFITEELKAMEDKILSADDMLLSLELELFNEIREKLLDGIERLQRNAALLAELDCYQSFADIASEYNYVRPSITDDNVINIIQGRHPVVEISTKEKFVANDLYLDNRDNRLLIITGPNMAGKSTYMRQTALITLMAHIGSYVPAKEASICLVDRIFTRIGASDDLATGQSTFMVEMSEMANILNSATPDSLLIIDEIGRGTSTFDGLSIAWSVLEHISDTSLCGAKTLFATHYHELTELEGKIEGVKNFQVSVKEYGDDIIFLRRITRGSGDRSFGIQVAKLAGLPENVLTRAKEILGELENADIAQTKTSTKNEYYVQYSLFDTNKNDALERLLDETDPDSLSPREALEVLYKIKAVQKNEM